MKNTIEVNLDLAGKIFAYLYLQNTKEAKELLKGLWDAAGLVERHALAYSDGTGIPMLPR